MDDDEARLVEWLRGRDAQCPLCKYNLRDLPSARCPECGNDLRLSVALVDPYQKAWIALMVATWAGAGAGAIFLPIIVNEGWVNFPPDKPFLKVAVFIFMAMIPSGVIIAWKRRTILRFPRRNQWLLASATIAMIMACFIEFALWIG